MEATKSARFEGFRDSEKSSHVLCCFFYSLFPVSFITSTWSRFRIVPVAVAASSVCRTMALELTGEQRTEVIRLIKRHIPGKGYCRVGWAVREAAGREFEKSIHLKEGIANTIIQSGEYIKEESATVADKDWNILINPQYKLVQFNKRTVMVNVILSIISGVAATIAIWRAIAFHVKP